MAKTKLIRQLKEVGARLEGHFGDMCDFEFTVQDGKLYVLNVRPGKRSPKAGIRIATDLFLEGSITGKTMLERIWPSQVAAILQPKINTDASMPQLGAGLPASPGAAVGAVAFASESVLKLIQGGNPVIFAPFNYTPEDLAATAEASGVVTPHGGMTSHAAVVARGLAKPCVVGVGWSFNRSDNSMTTPTGRLKEGDYITIDGNSGKVFAGFHDLYVPKASEDERLMLILRVIDALAATEELPYDRIGTTWRMRDLLVRGGNDIDVPDPTNRLQVWPTRKESLEPRAYLPLDRAQARALGNELFSFAVSRDDNESIYLLLGLRRWLQGFLAKYVGTGRHPSFYRPLFDPCDTVLDPVESGKWNIDARWRVQLVGEEYFSINHYVPECIEIESIRLYWATSCRKPQELWRIDSTNPHGEKLLEGAPDVLALKVVLNDGVVPPSMLPRLYNYLRGREYFLSWYDAHDISRHELKQLLASRAERVLPARERELLRSAGLLTPGGEITKVGLSLLRPDSAKERLKQNFRVGW